MLQVVAFQATMELMAEQFPGAFSGYKLEVVESHQRTKVDTSGTAKAVVASFQKLGLDFTEVSCVPRLLGSTSAAVVCNYARNMLASTHHDATSVKLNGLCIQDQIERGA